MGKLTIFRAFIAVIEPPQISTRKHFNEFTFQLHSLLIDGMRKKKFAGRHKVLVHMFHTSRVTMLSPELIHEEHQAVSMWVINQDDVIQMYH